VVNTIPGPSLACSAIRSSFVEMESKPEVFVIFPSCGSVIRPSLPSTGFPGAGSPTSRVLWKTPISPSLSQPPSASPWGPVPSPESFVRSNRPPSRDRRLPVSQVRVTAGPTRSLRRKEGDLPGSWGTFAHVPRSQTPAGPPLPGPFEEAMMPSVMSTTSAPASRISGLYHAAHALAVYASRRRSPGAAQDSLPAGGQP